MRGEMLQLRGREEHGWRCRGDMLWAVFGGGAMYEAAMQA